MALVLYGYGAIGIDLGVMNIACLDYTGLGIVMKVLTLTSAIVFYFFTTDPIHEKGTKISWAGNIMVMQLNTSDNTLDTFKLIFQ